MKKIQNRGTAAILDLQKSLISPETFDRFLPNFAGRRTEATGMFPISLAFEIDPKWRHSRHLGFAKIFNISGKP